MKKYIFGNWKMYLDFAESIVLANELSEEIFDDTKIEVAVFPSALAFSNVATILASTSIKVGPQDIAWEPKGAYTGAISSLMFKDLGAKYALIGHSERRYIFGETDEQVRKKIEAALDAGLVPVVCIGETKQEKDEGKREYRLKKQLMKAFADLNLNGGSVMVAYEPLWAISKAGVGEPCLPADADDIQGWIKLELKQYFSEDIPVLYGGSVTAENVLSYLSFETIAGVLVGSASTKFETFSPLIKIDKASN